MRTYQVGTTTKPAQHTVQASTIRQAIIAAADLLCAGVADMNVFNEEYTQVTFESAAERLYMIICV